ncbi:MAG: sigma-70 family RNA polymerase sigma factor [Anaerolineales bacterium]|jgi:RNA polymerase sigma-70 factor (ECF subfamily)
MTEFNPGQEKVWIEEALGGDDQSFTQLVEAYQRPVFNLCYRMLGDPLEAEDAAQESFLRAHRSLHRYDPERKFATWMLSIASHHCIDRLRRRRLKFVSMEDLLPGHDRPHPGPGPEDRFVRLEMQEEVQQMLGSLSAIDRAAVILLYWYEYSYEEIGSVLSLSVSAVKSRLHRARRELAIGWQMKHEGLVQGGMKNGPSAVRSDAV